MWARSWDNNIQKLEKQHLAVINFWQNANFFLK